MGPQQNNIFVCLVRGKQRDPKKTKTKKSSNSGEVLCLWSPNHFFQTPWILSVPCVCPLGHQAAVFGRCSRRSATGIGLGGCLCILWMDKIHFAPPEKHGKPLFVCVYRGIIISGFLRWCRILSIHSTSWAKPRPADVHTPLPLVGVYTPYKVTIKWVGNQGSKGYKQRDARPNVGPTGLPST